MAWVVNRRIGIPRWGRWWSGEWYSGAGAKGRGMEMHPRRLHVRADQLFMSL